MNLQKEDIIEAPRVKNSKNFDSSPKNINDKTFDSDQIKDSPQFGSSAKIFDEFTPILEVGDCNFSV